MAPAAHQPLRLVVEDTADVSAAARAARALAVAVGFTGNAVEEIAIVATELAMNLARHARGQRELTLTPLREAGPPLQTGLRMEALDEGPGIPDVTLALRDGFSTAGGAGLGLGTVNRLMDDLRVESHPIPHAHTRVTCQRWVHRAMMFGPPGPLETGVATRPKPGEELNGDAWIIERADGGLLVGVVDGLGHGRFAHRAARSACQYVETHADRPLAEIFRGTAIACQATRGVVMALARFDAGGGRMTFASIGDIEARTLGLPRPGFVIRRGILGAQAPNAVVTEHPWRPEWALVLHSDGVRSHWREEDLPGLRALSAQEMAVTLLTQFAREDDDATVLVVRSKAGGGTP